MLKSKQNSSKLIVERVHRETEFFFSSSFNETGTLRSHERSENVGFAFETTRSITPSKVHGISLRKA